MLYSREGETGMALKTSRIIAVSLLIFIIILWSCLLLLAGNDYQLVNSDNAKSVMVFIFFISLFYLIFTYIVQIKKVWVKQVLSLLIIVIFTFCFIATHAFLFWLSGDNFSPYRIFSDAKSSRAIIIYQTGTLSYPPDYRMGVIKHRIFFDTSTSVESSSYSSEVTFDWLTLNPKIVWEKDTATVYMPDNSIVTVWLE